MTGTETTSRPPNGRLYDKNVVWHPKGNIMLTWGTAAMLAVAIWQASEAFTELKGEISALVQVSAVQFENMDRRLTELTSRLENRFTRLRPTRAMPMTSRYSSGHYSPVVDGVAVEPFSAEE